MSVIVLVAALNLAYGGWGFWLVRRALRDLIRDQRRALAAAQKLEVIIGRAVKGEILVCADDGRIGRLVIEACGDEAIRLRVDDAPVAQVH